MSEDRSIVGFSFSCENLGRAASSQRQLAISTDFSTTQSPPRAAGGCVSSIVMPKKGKGKGDEEAADVCPADMDPEVWAIVKDVNALVQLAGKKDIAKDNSPVSRFQALSHLWSSAVGAPSTRDSLINAGALLAALSSIKSDVQQTDRSAGFGLLRCLTIGLEGSNQVPNILALEQAAENKVSTFALEELIFGNSPTAKQDALALLLGLVMHPKTRQNTVAKCVTTKGAWEGIAAMTTTWPNPVVRDASSFLTICCQYGDAAEDGDELSARACGLKVAVELSAFSKNLDFLLDAAVGQGEDGKATPPNSEEVSTSAGGSESASKVLSSQIAQDLLQKEREKTELEDVRLAACECLSYCAKAPSTGVWLLHGHRAPNVTRLVTFMRDATMSSVATRAACASVLFNCIDVLGVLKGTEFETAAGLTGDPEGCTGGLGSNDSEDGGTSEVQLKRKVHPRPLPGGFGEAAREAAAEASTTEILQCRLGTIVSAGAVGPLASVLTKAGALPVDSAKQSGLTRRNSVASELNSAGGENNAAGGEGEDIGERVDGEQPGSTHSPLDGEFCEHDDENGDEDDDEKEDEAKSTKSGASKKSKKGKKSKSTKGSEKKKSLTLDEKRRGKTVATVSLLGKRAAAGVFRYLTSYVTSYGSYGVGKEGSRSVVAGMHKVGGLRALVRLLKSSDLETKKHAQACLWNVANKKISNHQHESVGIVPEEHFTFLQDAKAPGYVTKVEVYGIDLAKLALRSLPAETSQASDAA